MCLDQRVRTGESPVKILDLRNYFDNIISGMRRMR